MNITTGLLKKWGACADGYKWFVAHFPAGADYAATQTELRKQKRYEWSTWLTEKVWLDVMTDPSAFAALTKSEVQQAIDETKDAPAASSGDGSKAASSGYGSKAASSGDYSKAASSGDGSKAASSGDGSTAASSGANTIAMVAGLYGQAKAGTNGCIALCWHDGKRNRIVTGYVGEDIDADTLYRVEAGKLVKV